jgi:divalent metal cation (Fe/Co/Zn/Cd) transporter/ketosteroid isomerase-like protein
LFTLGSVFAIAEGIDKLVHPTPIDSVGWAYGVLGVALVLETLSLRTARRESNLLRRGRTWWQFIHTTKNPELPVVLLEDTGALAGLFLAFVGITLNEITGDNRWDALGSLGIGVLLGLIAAVLAVEMKSLLIGEATSPQREAAIRDAMLDGPEVSRIIHLRTSHLGPEDILLATKVEFTTDSVQELARAIDRVEARVRASVPETTMIFIEPDLYRSVNGAEGLTMRDTETRAAVDRFNEAFNRHDVDGVMAAMTADCVFENTSPPDGGRFEGAAAVRTAWEEFFTASPSARFDAEDVIVAGDRCVVQWRYTWDNGDGTKGGIRGVDVIRVRDGKVAEKFAYVKG